MTENQSAGEPAIAAPLTFRKIFTAACNAGEARSLSVGKQSFGHPVVAKCVSWIQRIAPDASIHAPAYCRVEQMATGHDWHVDTGDSNHMTWCAYSGSVLLSKPESFSGGWFEFRNPPARHKHYLDLLTYSSDNWHRVTPHEGERRVLLLFLGKSNGIRS